MGSYPDPIPFFLPSEEAEEEAALSLFTFLRSPASSSSSSSSFFPGRNWPPSSCRAPPHPPTKERGREDGAGSDYRHRHHYAL